MVEYLAKKNQTLNNSHINTKSVINDGENKMDGNQNKLHEVSGLTIGQIELPQFDPSPYIGIPVKIAEAKIYEGRFGYMLKVTTEPIKDDKGKVVIFKGKNKEVPLTASKLFGLQEDAKGNIGWGEKTKLGVFLKKMGVTSYKDLVGKTVKLQSATKVDTEQEFLTFN